MTAPIDTRTPLWAMTDEQLRAYADDDLVDWNRRQTAAMILRDRMKEYAETQAGARLSEDDEILN